MCGICGMYRFDGAPAEPAVVERMCSAMAHRGPDDDGYLFDGPFAVGMRRLSIIDLPSGKQPISSEDGRFSVVLNGEIYNYLELRKELVAKGHVFRTNSDTEVIVHLFEERGEGCVESLNGMFAFAVWDGRERTLYVYRDRLGIKPLFYGVSDKRFLFGSDLLSLRTADSTGGLDTDSFLLYLGLSYVPCPYTIFSDFRKLPPGHYITVRSDGRTALMRYWDARRSVLQRYTDLDLCRDEVMERLQDSVMLQMRSDVPVGTFLSGGLDSSSVVAVLSRQLDRPVRTFSIGFEGGHNELPYAELVADRFKTNHASYTLRECDVPGYIDELAVFLDEPMYDNALVPTFALSGFARRQGVKVILNGTGGDEIFGGYPRHTPGGLRRLVTRMPALLRKVVGGCASGLHGNIGMKIKNPEFMALASGVNLGMLRRLLKGDLYERMINLLHAHFGGLLYDAGNSEEVMYYDLKSYLVDNILSLLDKMTMAHSIEGRVPLLDHRLVELLFSIPVGVKLRGNEPKFLFKYCLRELLPEQLFSLPKMGLSGPTPLWVNGQLKSSIMGRLVDGPAGFITDHIKAERLKEGLAATSVRDDECETLFGLYMFSLWHDTHMRGPRNGVV